VLKGWEKYIVITELSSEFIKSSYIFSGNAPDFIRASAKLCAPGADKNLVIRLLWKSYFDILNPPLF
jgi:hypothetical protein